MTFSGSPPGLTIEIGQGNPTVYTDASPYTVRKSVHITRPRPGQPGRMQLDLWSQGAAYTVADLAHIRAYDPYSLPSGVWTRYFDGYVITPRITTDGNANLKYSLDCVDQNWLWQNPPAMPTAKTRVGAAPVWLPNHPYLAGDVVQATPSNSHKYTASLHGTSGKSGATQPTFPTGAGATVTEGSAGPPDTRITWTESGSSLVTDITAINAILDIYFPSSLITITRNYIQPLIASVESIEIDVDWTADRAMQEVAKQAQSTGYYAVYNQWVQTTAYKVGDLIEQSPSVHGIIFRCITAGTSHTGAAPAFTSVVDLGSTIADGGGSPVMWIAAFYTGRWEASTTYVAGTRIEPQTGALTGFYYQCVTGGATAASPPGSWTTTLGATVTSGSAVFMCMGATSVAPVWQFRMPSDNIGHTGVWTQDVAWYDSNSTGATGIQLLTPEYSDVITADSTHIHYSEITANREGGNYANCWFVWGQNGSFARVASATEISSKGGMVVAKTHVDTSENGPLDYNACVEKGNELLFLSTFRETVQITSPDPLDPVMIQQIAIAKVTSSLLGLASTQYTLANAEVDFSEGPAVWKGEFGAPLLTDREDPLSQHGRSREYQTSGYPPALVTFGSDWVLDNYVDPTTHMATVDIQWRSGHEATLDRFYGQIQVTGEGSRRTFGPIFYSQQSATIGNLPQNTVCTFYIDAVNHASQHSGYATSPPLTTAQHTSPVAPSITGVTSGAEEGGVFWADVVVAHPAGDHSGGGTVYWRIGSGPTHVGATIPPGQTFPYTARVHNLSLGATYIFTATVLDAFLFTSPVSADFPYTIVVSPPAAPTIGAITQGHNIVGFFANIPLSGGGDHTRGGHIYWTKNGADQPNMEIPPGVTFPWTANTGPQLITGDVLVFYATVVDQYDQQSAKAGPANYTILPDPPAAPGVNSTIRTGYDSALGYFVCPVVTHPSGDHSGGGTVYYQPQTGPQLNTIRFVTIPGNAVYPYTAIIPHLSTEVTYNVWATVTDAYGQPSAVSTPTRTVRPTGGPLKDPPVGGWDAQALDDSLAGWMPQAPAVVADYTIDAVTAPFDGYSTLWRDIAANLTRRIESGYQFRCTPGEKIDFKGAILRNTSTGTAPTCALKVQPYLADGVTAVGGLLTAFSLIPGTTWLTTASEGVVTIPATAVRFSLVYEVVSAVGAGTYRVWFAFPRFTRQLIANDHADGSVGNAQLDVITDPAKIALWLSSGNYRPINDSAGALVGKESVVGLAGGVTTTLNYGVETGGANPTTGARFNHGNGDTFILLEPAGNLDLDAGTTNIILNHSGAIAVTGDTGIAGKTRLGDNSTATAVAHIKAGTASANTAPLKLTSGTLLTTPEAGASEYDGTNFYDTPVVNRHRRVLAGPPITATQSWSNSAAESGALFTEAISANEMKAGRALLLRLWGFYQETIGGTDTGTLRVKCAGIGGGAGLVDVIFPAVTSAKPFYVEFMLTCYTAGASGTAWYDTHASINSVVTDQAKTTVSTIDTTVADDLTMTFQWSAAHTNSIFTLTQAQVTYS